MDAPTKRGQRARRQILHAARELFRLKGVEQTSLEDAMNASGTVKSQVYHYFGSKNALVTTALRDARAEAEEALAAHNFGSWKGIREWFDNAVHDMNRSGCVGGSFFGSLAAELADTHPAARKEIEKHFIFVRTRIAAGLKSLQERGALRQGADTAVLALFATAGLQGGILLSKTSKNITDLKNVCRQLLAHLQSFKT